MTPIYRFGDFRLDARLGSLTRGGAPTGLGPRAVRLLAALVAQPNEYVSKDDLLARAWPGLVVEEANLSVQMSAIRRELRLGGGPSSPHIETLPRRGYRFVGAVLRDDGPAPTPAEIATPAAAAPVGNLPDVLPRLFGRDDDLRRLEALMDEWRLLTIVGPGGIGKTRVALALANVIRGRYADGAWIVDLSPLEDGRFLAATMAGALGIRLAGREPAHAEVAGALRGRELVLLLDNCERMTEAVGALATSLLAHVAGLRLVTTSQEPLQVQEERVYRLPTLALPATGDRDEARRSPALELLVHRVRARETSFTLAERDVDEAAEVCRRLDGLPLAIELAAARVPLLGVAGVRERLDERFRLLTTGARGAPERQQTLRATIDWSHGLLGDAEAAVFRRIGVFPGSLALRVAQRAVSDEHLDEWDVLDRLGMLVDKSLLIAEASAPGRYRMLQSTRAYAVERLRDAGEFEIMQRRHAAAVRPWFEEGLARRWTATRAELLEHYLPDLDSLRAALDWSVDADPEAFVALAAASLWIWASVDQRHEGLRRGETALARVHAGTPTALEARLQLEWLRLAIQERGPAPRAAAERAIALFRALGDDRGLYQALGWFARNAAVGSDIAGGLAATAEMARLIDDTWPELARWEWLYARVFVVYVGFTDFLDQGPGLVDQMMQVASDTNDDDKLRIALAWRQLIANVQGNYAEAVRLGREVISMARRDRFGSSDLANYVCNQCLALAQLGDVDEGLTTAREAVMLMGQRGTLWHLMDTLSLLACRRGRWDAAARALGRAEAANRWRGGAREPAEQRVRDAAMQWLRQQLPAEALQALLDQGELLSDLEVARMALED